MLYPAVAASGFRRYATYRVATAAGVVTNVVFGLIMAYTYVALWEERPRLGGYDLSQALAFVWLGQALLAATAIMGGGFEVELADRIRSGDVVIDLYRPVDLQLWWMANDLGRAAFHLVGRGVLPMVCGVLLFDVALPPDVWRWPLFLLSVLLGTLVGFAIRYLVALTAFWLLDDTGVSTASGLLSMFFSGMLLPLTVFPGELGELARVLPWSALLQVPVDVFLGRHTGWGLVGALAFQAAWAAVLLAAGRVPAARADRKVVVQGG